MSQRIKVLLLIPHLGGGGAEQVTSLLTRGLCQDRFDLHLGVITQKNLGEAWLFPGVSVHALGASRVRAATFGLLQLVRELKPQAILSGMAHLNFLVLLLRPLFPKRTCVLVRQNGTASEALAFGALPRWTRLLYLLTYRRADRIICQSDAMARDLARLKVPARLLAVLPNPVDLAAIRSAGAMTPDQRPKLWPGSKGPHLFAVARLSPEKGLDLLLFALVTVRRRFPDADLVILGAGPAEEALKAQCGRLSLDSAVSFAGYIEHPASYFPGASLFVLPSRHEGMPNALLEAAAAGLPMVATPASWGVVELLQGQPGAWLTHGISSIELGASILAALDVLEEGQRFAHPFIEAFGMDRVIPQYEELIGAVLKERGR
jgi:glycosyltransferase involved in cell wall biosynthesis